MKLDHPAFRYVALAMGLWLLAGAIWSASLTLGQVLVGFGGFAFLGAIVHTVAHARRARYDLGQLREIHERAELESVEDVARNDLEFVICMHCGQEYHRRFPTCPRCAEL